MITDNVTLRPRITFLSQEDHNQIHHAALRILGDIGMQILHKEALLLLKDTGCLIEQEHIVKIPSKLVEDAVNTAPRNIPIYNRQGQQVMDLGGYRCYFGTGSDLMYPVEAEQFKVEACLHH